MKSNIFEKLFDNSKILEFWPSKYQNHEDKINALFRFILYGGILLSLHNQNASYVLLALIIIFLIAMYIEKKTYKPKKNNVHRCTNPKMMKNVPQDCQKPTEENPFANVLITDYTDNPDRPPACATGEVVHDINNKFRKNLYMDIDSIYEKENSERQFFSTANTTIPNDQVNFAKWLYEPELNCKTKPKDCK